jgi:hypothetical protein
MAYPNNEINLNIYIRLLSGMGIFGSLYKYPEDPNNIKGFFIQKFYFLRVVHKFTIDYLNKFDH